MVYAKTTPRDYGKWLPIFKIFRRNIRAWVFSTSNQLRSPPRSIGLSKYLSKRPTVTKYSKRAETLDELLHPEHRGTA